LDSRGCDGWPRVVEPKIPWEFQWLWWTALGCGTHLVFIWFTVFYYNNYLNNNQSQHTTTFKFKEYKKNNNHRFCQACVNAHDSTYLTAIWYKKTTLVVAPKLYFDGQDLSGLRFFEQDLSLLHLMRRLRCLSGNSLYY